MGRSNDLSNNKSDISAPADSDVLKKNENLYGAKLLAGVSAQIDESQQNRRIF